MTPFSILCDSCQSNLKVTKRSAIGQILACPKCGSLVQVVPPEDWVDDQATDQGSELASDQPSKPDANESSAAGTSAISEGQQKKSGQQKKRRSSKSPDEAQPQTGAASEEASKSPSSSRQDLLPSDAWTSAEAQARKKIIGLVCVVGLLLVVAVSAIGFVAAQLGKGANRSEVAENESDPSSSGIPDSTPESTSNDQESEPSNTDAETTDPDTQGTDTGPDVDMGTGPENKDDNNQTPPPDSDTTGNDATGTGAEDNFNEPPETASSPEESSNDTTPPGFETAEGGPSPFDLVLGDLNALGSIMEESAFDKARAIAERELQVAYRIRVTPEEVFAERPKPREFDVEKQMDVVLPSIQVDSISLLGLIRLIHQLTSVPVSIDATALVASEVDLSQAVTVSGDSQSVGEVLANSLAPLGLGWHVQGDMVVVSLLNANLLETREFDLGSLAASFSAEENLLEPLIQAMIDPMSWSVGSGATLERRDGKLIVHQQPLNLHRIGKFLSDWQNRLQDEAPEAMPPSRRELARSLLESPVSLEHLQPVPLSQLVDELSDQVDGNVVVDWARLAEQGWTVDTELTCNLLDLPLGFALEDALRPAGLSFRIINEKLIQVTTMEAALGDPDVEFYSVKPLIDSGIEPAELAAKLPSVFRAVGSQEAGKRFYYDPDAQILVAALPQPQQRALARFLRAWAEFQVRPTAR